jgi:polyphosphate kinase
MGLIDYEINEAKAGRPARIYLKLNSLLDEEGIIKLYEASRSGVEVRLVVRGICGLVPHIKNLSEKIEAFSIVDKFLEHSRLFYFWHSGQEKIYMSSADLMTRNIDHRIEVACPIESPELKKELKHKLEIFWRDNTKSRIIDHSGKNHYKQGPAKYRAQKDIYEYLKNK